MAGGGNLTGEKIMRRYTLEEIHDTDDGILTYQDDKLRYLVARALSRAPAKVVEHAFKRCLFIAPRLENERGIHFHRWDIPRHKDLILLPENLLSKEADEVNYVILHEVGHSLLKHRMTNDEEKIVEYNRQADELAYKWLEKSNEKKSLRRKINGRKRRT